MAPKRRAASDPSSASSKRQEKAPQQEKASKPKKKPKAPTGAYLVERRTKTGIVKHDVWYRTTAKKPQYILRAV